MQDEKNLKHWTAIYCDGGTDFCYYDPLAINDRYNEIKKIFSPILASKYTHYLKYKMNGIKNQSDKSSYCGYYCIRFIWLMINGLPFKDITNIASIVENEKNIKQFEKNLKEFEYI